MPTSVTMPALGESVTEGTVTRWLKQEGQQVEVDEPLLEVSTDKVDTEIPSSTAGVLRKILVPEDQTAVVGAELAVIDGDADRAAGIQSGAAEQPQAAPESATADTDRPGGGHRASGETPTDTPARQVASGRTAPTTRSSGDGGAYVTPLVRRLAVEHGVDLTSVTGTGIGGRVRKQDVLVAAEQAASRDMGPAVAQATTEASVRGRTEKLSRLRTLIADRMVESLQVSAQLTTVVEADVTNIARLRQRAKADFEAREGVKLSFLPFFAQAAIEALKAYPVLNSSIDLEAGTITYHDAEDLGIAVDTERGLLVPVIHGAGDLNLGGLAQKIADLAERTRANKVTPDELDGGTFTLTNTGSRGALFDTPIINQPQVAILGTGSVVKRPVVVQDAELGEVIAVRSMVYLALTYDHRIVDGADAARFLTTVKERLESGQYESELGLL
ncbi:2-oxoglutarate dehydrogenase, E2 component, dihydrolipoamide succinyltransferase [Streptomyces sp. NPDC097610]|uniref:2-oxoglutarate dehydrogenase, E2 component, dihydrolipoamide succinyltransferase n=1 Tax=Streptomyces sp. NPDC097610 TaxID=3157227 RepID=UPI003321F58E